uniref:Tryptophan synthase alpha chain n=1 Tax=Bornetia secundiflora TaxID=2575637 RepID=A0A4D6WNE8_9FLOR|nr:Tryptophan synthase alpha subunit [Bornetia secundiflora]
MNIISQILYTKHEEKSCALIPFITAGYPTVESTLRALRILDSQGADIIELGIPYSDALADGPIIQESSKIALQQGVYISQVFMILKNIYHTIKAPIIIFTYYNPILVTGISNFIKKIAEFGAKGLVIPDLPIEEMDYIIHVCNIYSIELIFFIAPTSSQKRISYILSKASNCIYLVSSTGVTGTRKSIDSQVITLSNYIKSSTDKLIMLGFGISNAEQATEIAQWNIDGIVIGSAFIKVISLDNSLELLSSFCKSIKDAISNI